MMRAAIENVTAFSAVECVTSLVLGWGQHYPGRPLAVGESSYLDRGLKNAR